MDVNSLISLPPIISVDVVNLRGILPNHVDQYMQNAINAPSVTLHGADAQLIANLWRSMPPGEQSRCHTPPYGVRFRVADRIVCEASICWECENIFGNSEGKDLHYKFNARHQTSIDLFTEFQRAFGETA
jgi:hypothetical protein